MYGPQASFLTELFPAKVRYTGASVGCQLVGVLPAVYRWPLAKKLGLAQKDSPLSKLVCDNSFALSAPFCFR
jgi:hypothetical protein